MQFRHAKESRNVRHLPYTGFKVATSVGIYWMVVSVIPIYNKVVFNGVAGDKGFPYPLTTTFFQLFVGFVMLFVLSILQRMCLHSEPHHSWILGPNWQFKLKTISTVGLLFGIKLGITNWGLKLIPLGPHLLLQSTDIMWTVLFAHIINKERLNAKEFVCSLGTLLGSILIAIRTQETTPGLFALGINLCSPILLGLVITELRKAAKILLIDESIPTGRVPNMGTVELTAFKLFFSATAVLPFVYLLEMREDHLSPDGLTYLNWNNQIPVLEVLKYQNPMLTLVAFGGGFFLVIFQVNITWLSKLVSAVSVGIVGGVKVIPQWIGSLIFYRSFDINPYHISGVILLLVSSILWTKIKYTTSLTTYPDELEELDESLTNERERLMRSEADRNNNAETEYSSC